MIINDEIIRTMNYVKETSSRTEPKTFECRYRGCRSDDELFSLDYSDIPCPPLPLHICGEYVEEEIEVDGVKKKVKVWHENDDEF